MALTDMERAFAQRSLTVELMKMVNDIREDYTSSFPGFSEAKIDADLVIDGTTVRMSIDINIPESLWDMARDALRAEMMAEGKC
jgi:hypothetical protein